MATVVVTGPNNVEVTLAGIGAVKLRAPGDGPDAPSVLFDVHASAEALRGIVDGSITEIEAWQLDGAAVIRDYAFYGTSLETIEVPTGVTDIGTSAFQNCADLASVTLPTGLLYIGNSAFNSCEALESITIPSSVVSVGQNAFGYSGLRSISFPSGITTIGSFVCAFSESLETVVWPAAVPTVPNRAFVYCTSLTDVTIPNGVTALSSGVFWGCSALPQIDLPAAIGSIGSLAFADCTSLTSLTCRATTPPTIYSDTFSNVPANCIIKVPSGSVNEYKAASGWSSRAAYIQAI